MKSLDTLKSMLRTISAKSLHDSFVIFILILEVIYSALLAVLTSAIVALCSSNINCYTKYALFSFVCCVILLIVLLSHGQIYNKCLLIKKSQNDEEPSTSALNAAMKLMHRGKETLWKWIITICFCGLLAGLYFFSNNSLKSIRFEKDSKKAEYVGELSRKIDSLENVRKNDTCLLKEIKLSLDELKQLQQEQNDALSRLKK